MKKRTLPIALALFPFLLVTAASAASETAPKPAHVIIEIKGLACPFCVQGIEKHLKKLDAVEAVDTSLKKGEVVLHLKSGRTVIEKEVHAAVKKAGFTVEEIRFDPKRTPDKEEIQ